MSSGTATAPQGAALEPQVQQFVQTKLNSLVKWDLVQAFHANPGLLTNAPKLASLTGRDLRQVEQELRELARSGVLEVHEVSGLKAYQLSTERETRALVTAFVEACRDKHTRQRVIYALMAAH